MEECRVLWRDIGPCGGICGPWKAVEAIWIGVEAWESLVEGLGNLVESCGCLVEGCEMLWKPCRELWSSGVVEKEHKCGGHREYHIIKRTTLETSLVCAFWRDAAPEDSSLCKGSQLLKLRIRCWLFNRPTED